MPSTKEEWPNMAVESQGPLLDSIIMYALPDLHAMARQGLLKEADVDAVVNFPVKNEIILDIVMNNQAALQSFFRKNNLKRDITALFIAKEEVLKAKEGKEGLMQSEIVAIDDNNAESELVYGISKCDVTKRISVVFRGSVTAKDFMVDADAFIVDINNPIKPDSKEKLGIHKGFYDYMYATPKRKDGETDVGAVNKYNEIISQLKVIFQQNPGYQLYITGHSLGASLAQLFAMEAAASKDDFIPKPVTTINFASPKVGNVYYRYCVESLEDQGLLRILRFVNFYDVIPTLPDYAPCTFLRSFRCIPSVYQHAGPKVILYPNGEFDIRYEHRGKENKWNFASAPKRRLGFYVTVLTVFRNEKVFLANHKCREYILRFAGFAKRGGDKIHLNDVYTDSEELANLLENGFK